MTYTLCSGDKVIIDVALYINDYDYNSAHYKCYVDKSPNIDKHYNEIYIPINISTFGYKLPPEIYFTLPYNFNLMPQTVINQGHYIFKPEVLPTFSKDGKIYWRCLEDSSKSFYSNEGVRKVANEDTLRLIANTIKPRTLCGIVDRIFRKKLGTDSQELLYVETLNVSTIYNEVSMSLMNFICVILIEDYEIYIPSFFIKKGYEKKN